MYKSDSQMRQRALKKRYHGARAGPNLHHRGGISRNMFGQLGSHQPGPHVMGAACRVPTNILMVLP